MNFKSNSSNFPTFLEDIGNLLLPGSVNPFVPRWDAELPSQNFMTEVAKFANEIDLFKELLKTRFEKLSVDLKEEDIQICIKENAPATRRFLQTVGELYIYEYYSRAKNLLALGLPPDPPFPTGSKPKLGNFEILEKVFLHAKPYR